MGDKSIIPVVRFGRRSIIYRTVSTLRVHAFPPFAPEKGKRKRGRYPLSFLRIPKREASPFFPFFRVSKSPSKKTGERCQINAVLGIVRLALGFVESDHGQIVDAIKPWPKQSKMGRAN
jgi:hypothetical protein